MKSEPPQGPRRSRPGRARGERPSLVVRNLQRRHPVDGRRLTSFLAQLAIALGQRGSATLALVSDSWMQRLNRDFRGFDEPTDVLSFPSDDRSSGSEYLGDIVISVETAHRQARRLGSTLRASSRS